MTKLTKINNMKTININTQEGVKLILFPDNQPHVIVDGINEYEEVKVICAIKDSITLINLLQVSNALTIIGAVKKELHIPYLMGARFDRIMQVGDSFDLDIIAGLINGCDFDKVVLYDVHSHVSTSLILRSTNVSNQFLVDEYRTPNAVLICPDKGARFKVPQLMLDNKNLTDVVYCDKSRDLTNGNLTLTVLEPEKCLGRDCVIIDDLCDGGGTFLIIASQIKPKTLTLIVTHGIFSKGFHSLNMVFDRIITSDSYKSHYDSPRVNVVKVDI